MRVSSLVVVTELSAKNRRGDYDPPQLARHGRTIGNRSENRPESFKASNRSGVAIGGSGSARDLFEAGLNEAAYGRARARIYTFSNLQVTCRNSCKPLQILSGDFRRSANRLNRFGIFHGRRLNAPVRHRGSAGISASSRSPSLFQKIADFGQQLHLA